MVAFGFGLNWSSVLHNWGRVSWSGALDWGVVQFMGRSSVNSLWSGNSSKWFGGNLVDWFGFGSNSLDRM